uniref:Uncharacterized protein n=1 Tax=Zea mays TaxID=4577 RepID=B4FM50_MAIZE|nr:unknown [Zea mays]|eukprot:NP_001137066.1 uncharacterized protein LOC100217239 [Zea mays]
MCSSNPALCPCVLPAPARVLLHPPSGGRCLGRRQPRAGVPCICRALRRCAPLAQRCVPTFFQPRPLHPPSGGRCPCRRLPLTGVLVHLLCTAVMWSSGSDDIL